MRFGPPIPICPLFDVLWSKTVELKKPLRAPKRVLLTRLFSDFLAPRCGQEAPGDAFLNFFSEFWVPKDRHGLVGREGLSQQ